MREPGDVVVASIHWGSNWGYDVPATHTDFAHRLIDAGVDVVHGHSSHHPRPIEVYQGKLILYGCGDLIDDYEGIGGYQKYRDDLRLLYFATVSPGTGRMAACEVCGNDYWMAFEVHTAGEVHLFDSFECAIHRLAPVCEHCGCRIVGHGVEINGRFFCCAHCARSSGMDRAVEIRDTVGAHPS